jgi:CHAD domain-containing protein
MAYRFKRKESVTKAVRRLGCERIEHARQCLKDGHRPKAIHEVRKDIKKVRAVLRLARPRLAKKDVRRLTNALREAATHLAAPRDAYVMAQTLRDLAEHFAGQLAPRALRHTRTQLHRSYEDATKHFWKEKTERAVERRLRRVEKILEGVKARGKEWKALGPGVKSAYRRGRRAYRSALANPVSENFHAWRKRAKDLWYQTKLLHSIWPEQMEAMAGELDSLGKCLGADHDLAVLRQKVEQQPIGDSHPQELEILQGLIEQRQRELRADALALGARFYTEKPSVFCGRLARYWQTWRREKTRSAADAAS